MTKRNTIYQKTVIIGFFIFNIPDKLEIFAESGSNVKTDITSRFISFSKILKNSQKMVIVKAIDSEYKL